MRRTLCAAFVVGALTISCVSNDPGPTVSPPYQGRQLRPLPERSARRQPVTPPTAVRAKPSNYVAAWAPRGRRMSRRWTHLVIHHSATDRGGASRFDRHHRVDNGWDELGYHFVIGNGTDTPDGYVEVGPRWHKQKHGAHCKTPDNYYNDHGIGICLVGDFTRSRPTARQLASLESLTRFLCTQCRIPPSKITTHRAVTRKTACPGHLFDVGQLRRSLAGAAGGPSAVRGR